MPKPQPPLGSKDNFTSPVEESVKDCPTVEEGDYYIENGYWVFRAQYHLRRGACCGSGCRHCPY